MLARASALPRPRRWLTAGLALTAVGCGLDDDGPSDPLDRATLGQLASAQGSAIGDARTGLYELTLTKQTCDCPALDLDGGSVDLCGLAELGPATVDVTEGSGRLGVTLDARLLTGAIEADGAFVLAGIEDLASLGVSLEALRRLDGQFDATNDAASGWAGQRLVGESITGTAIDCRWIGSFVLRRL